MRSRGHGRGSIPGLNHLIPLGRTPYSYRCILRDLYSIHRIGTLLCSLFLYACGTL
jgi:hypothetical protein